MNAAKYLTQKKTTNLVKNVDQSLKSYDEVFTELNEIQKEYNSKIINVANSCRDKILVRAISVHSPDFKGSISNPIDLFIKQIPTGVEGKFVYGGC